MALLKSGGPNIGEAIAGFEDGPWARRPKTVTDYINTDRGLQFVEIGRPLNLEELGETYGITNR